MLHPHTQTYITGFAVSKNKSAICSFSSSVTTALLTDFPSSKRALYLSNASSAFLASLSPVLAARATFCNFFSTESRSFVIAIHQ
jgi:hypothetical protein